MASSNVYILWDTVGLPSPKTLVSEFTALFSYVLPPMLCYLVMAVLVVTPNTRTMRVAVCLVMILLTLRAVIGTPDTSLESSERKFYHNFMLVMFLITFRTFVWAFAKEPLVRPTRPGNRAPSALVDAFDLASSLRGHCWEWSRRVHIPRETRPTDRAGFLLYTMLSAASHTFIASILHVVVRSSLREPILHQSFRFLHTPIRVFFPVGLGGIYSGSIFDDSLPFFPRFLRSSVISILALVCSYALAQAVYDIATIFGVLTLGQDPTEWPPVFDAPWRATSVADFWGRRWHQLIRHSCLSLAGYPLYFIFGRAGIIIGAFFASAVTHHILVVSFNKNSEFWRMLVGFGMMGVGIIIEQAFKYVTGRKVRGIAGWFWTLVWILLWGHIIVEGHLRAGMAGFSSFIDLMPSVRMFLECLVSDFDVLLHTL